MSRLVSVLVVVWFVLASAVHAEPERSDSVIKVVTSFSILADLVQQVGGDRVEVVSLVGMEEDAHAFRARPQDVKVVASADLLVTNGMGFDSWFGRLESSAGYSGNVLVASEGIDAIHLSSGFSSHKHHAHSHGRVDPHAWHSIDAVKVYVANIAGALVELDPDNKTFYLSQVDAYLAQLEMLQSEMMEALSKIPQESRNMIVPHNAFAYLAREFGLNIYSIQGVSTESEGSAYQVARIVNMIRKKNVRAVFTENVSNSRLVEQLEKDVDITLGGMLISDALSEQLAPDYVSLVRYNLAQIVAALSSP